VEMPAGDSAHHHDLPEGMRCPCATAGPVLDGGPPILLPILIGGIAACRESARRPGRRPSYITVWAIIPPLATAQGKSEARSGSLRPSRPRFAMPSADAVTPPRLRRAAPRSGRALKPKRAAVDWARAAREAISTAKWTPS